MSELKKAFIVILLVFMLIVLGNLKAFAKDAEYLLQKVEYTEEFKKWIAFTKEEKENSIMPRMYEIENTEVPSKNPLYIARKLKASLNSRYSLKDVIPANLIIRNQQHTNSCWAFAALSSLETNLALSNYKRSINLSKVYDFSERHMEYATSKTFANNVKNQNGYNREVGSGGSYLFSHAYLTNGSGAIPEAEMPFKNNEDKIDISEIKNKTVSTQVYDTVEFPDYGNETGENRTKIINQIKQHIQDYGSVDAVIHGNSSDTSAFQCYNNATGAKFCNSSSMHNIDHEISIIGWDDKYSVNNFAEGARPKSNGAWIVRNSWGERSEEYKLSELKEAIFNAYQQECIDIGWDSPEKIQNEFIEQVGYVIEGDMVYMPYGDNGLIYISYEDVNISKLMAGIVKATDTVNYDYIYQYDQFYPGMYIHLNTDSMKLCNIFNKKTAGTEYLTQVSIYAPETYTCKVYVNPNGTSKSENDLQLVALKSGESETFNAGYHTLEFSKPIEIKANSFAVVLEVQGAANRVVLALESKIDGVEDFDSVTMENGKCFVGLGNNLGICQWIDLSRLTDIFPSVGNGDSSIKAYTTTELIDESLKNIEITVPPTKTSYFEGENFDKTGMVVKANYNSKKNPSVILGSSSYSIINGTNLKAGQTDVTITYEDKSVKQKINVEKNSVVELNIKTPPRKTEYKEGQHFDKTGMIVEATFKNGTTKIISDYTIENGNNLKANQTQVTISYDGKTISQPIVVIPNPLIDIKITKAPNKTKYVVGQNFDKTGMVVTGIYQDETTQEIIDYTIENGSNLVLEQSSVIIKYEGKIATQPITVEEKAITEILISKKPSKIQYIQNKEELDLTGGVLKVNYNDNSSENIDLTSEQVKVTGFDNKKIGKNTISVTYQSKTTTFDVEIIAEAIPQNSNFDRAKCDINSATYYTFSDKNIQEYLIMDITVSKITKSTGNDSYEYYYYLSSNKDENNITNWVKIKEKQTSNDELQFQINTKDIKNYDDSSEPNNLYLYIKEVAIKGGNQSVITNTMKIDSDVTVEIYIDNTKVINGDSKNPSSSEDTTMAPTKIPQAGAKNILMIILIISIAGIVVYIKYKNLSKYVK